MGRQRSTIISNSASHSTSLHPAFKNLPVDSKAFKRLERKLHKKSARRRIFAFGLVGGNLAILALVGVLLLQNPHQTAAETPALLSNAPSEVAANPLDQVSSANIAETVARLSSLPETTAITNQADSETTELSMAPTTNNVIEKPQVVATKFVSNKDIKTYVTKPGETITSIAAQFGITSDSIRWSNNISGNAIGAGVKLLIPPVSGIVYTVRSGDTPASLAAKYKADAAKIIATNDAEQSGLAVGERILIPDGTKAAAVASSAAHLLGTATSWGGTATYGYNGYDFGYCTWWVAKLRAAAGNPVPTNLGNASTWAVRAAGMGLPTGSTPRVGAAVVLKTVDAGHVAYVTAVNGDGTMTISEMNHTGWDVSDTRTIPVGSYEYVY